MVIVFKIFAAMGDCIYEGTVEKFSLGRSTGLTTRNWKTRHMRLTRSTLAYMDKPGAAPKLEVPINAISLVFSQPTKAEHEEADPTKPMLCVRIFENGVFNLLMKIPSEGEKAKWLAGFREALATNKGVQFV